IMTTSIEAEAIKPAIQPLATQRVIVHPGPLVPRPFGRRPRDPNVTHERYYAEEAPGIMGVGFNSLTGYERTSGIVVSDDLITHTHRNQTYASIQRIESQEHLLQEVAINAEAAASFGWGSGSAKMSFVRSVNFNYTSIFMLVSVKVIIDDIRL